MPGLSGYVFDHRPALTNALLLAQNLGAAVFCPSGPPAAAMSVVDGSAILPQLDYSIDVQAGTCPELSRHLRV